MAEQRRGLPRTRGGDAWPPAGTLVPAFVATNPVAQPSAAPSTASVVTTDAVTTDAVAPTAVADAQSAPAAAAPAAAPVVVAAKRRMGLGGTPAERLVASIVSEAPAAPAAVTPAVDEAAPVASVTAAPVAQAASSAVLTAKRRVGLGATPAESPAALAAIAEAAAAAPAAQAAQAAAAPAVDVQATEPAPAAPAPVAPAPVAPSPAGAQASVNQPAEASAPAPAATPITREPVPFRRSPAKITLAAIGVLVVIALIVTVDRWFLFHTSAGASFLKAFPGTTPLPKWAPVGQPLWTQWQHWLNAFFIVLIIKTGWTVRTQKKASAMWQPKKGGKKISIELFTHLSLDVVWLVNGVVFWILLFVSGQWVRIVPISWAYIPNAVSAVLQYASLWSWPTEDGWTNYNSIQVLTYFATVFLAAPLAAATGFRMSPMWSNKWARLSKIYPVELARKIHFPVMVYFVLFVIVHVVLVLSTGALRNLNHMFWGSDSATSWIGFSVFMLGIAAIIAAWFVLKPMVMQQIGGVFGKVGR